MTAETAETIERTLDRSELRLAHDTRLSVQRLRIELGERGRALDQGRDEVEGRVESVYTQLSHEMERIEARIDREIQATVRQHPAWPWLEGIRGVGPGLAGQLLAMLPDPGPEYGVGTWYKVCGLVPERRTDKVHGEQWRLPRRHKPEPTLVMHDDCAGEGCDDCDGLGEILRKPTQADTTSYYPPLRRTLWNISTSFLRAGIAPCPDCRRRDCPDCAGKGSDCEACDARRASCTTCDARGQVVNGYYAEVYEHQKARLRALHEGESAWPPIRSERVARWATIKLFLSHLWERWSIAAGLEYRRPYIVETDGRHAYIPPPEQG